MKHLFIINPAAGSRDRTKDYSVAIHELCTAKDLDFVLESPCFAEFLDSAAIVLGTVAAARRGIDDKQMGH